MVGMASIPEREEAMLRAVGSLAPQVDRVVVALNEYESIPAGLAAFPNVEPVLLDGSGGDAEKFAAVDTWDGFVATADDDLLYPGDYIETCLAGIERHGPDYTVTFHGGTTLGWNGSAVAASHKRIRCLGELLEDDTDVNVVGTGVSMYDARHVPVWRSVFRHANMADVQFACHARTMGMKMVALAHRAGWLADICPPVGEGRRIYESQRGRGDPKLDTSKLREDEIKRFNWLERPPKRPRVRVSVSTCGRPALLQELLEDLAREARWVDVELMVYHDPKVRADYYAAQAFCRKQRWGWYTFPKGLGREDYWRVVHKEFRDAMSSTAEWFMFLPDDVRLVRHAIPKAISTWYRLDDPAALTLWRLQSLEGQANWTGMAPVQRRDATEIFHLDGLYLCKRAMLDLLGFRIGRPRSQPPTGSGVGKELSRRLHGSGKRLYRVDASLAVANGDGQSMMNPDERRRNPTVTL